MVAYNHAPQKTFLLLGGIFGFLFLLVTPPFQVADEHQHFLHGYNFSEGRIRAQLVDGRGGDYLPASLSLFYSTVNRSVIATHPENKQDLKDLWAQFHKPLNPEQRTFQGFSDTARYCPVVYLPQAIGITLGRWCNSPPVIIFYLGRLTNLLGWCLMIALAIKLIPFFKWVTLLLALTPMSLFQSASLSADGLANGISLLTVSYSLYLAFGPVERIQWKHWLILFGLGVLLAFTKQIYILLIGLYCLIPTSKFNSPRERFFSSLILFLAGAAALFGWYFFYMGLYPPATFDGVVQFAPGEQLRFILGNPWGYLAILWATLKKMTILWMAMYVGILGWIDTPLPLVVYYSFYPLLGLVIWGDSHPTVALSMAARLTSASVFLISLTGILAVLYLTWNRLQSPIIHGLQGRYLIPIAPLAVLPFYYSRPKRKASDWIGQLVSYYLVVILLITLYTLIKRYYLP
jgi:uncharacterized membrane protein